MTHQASAPHRRNLSDDIAGLIDRVEKAVRTRWPGGAPHLGDVLITVALCVVGFPFVFQVLAEHGAYDLGVLAVALVGYGMFTLPFLWRRTFPMRMTLVVVLAHALQLVLLNEPTTLNVAAPLAVYAVARWADERRYRRGILAFAALASLVAGLDWTVPFMDGAPLMEHVAAGVTVMLLCFGTAFSAWLLGALVRQRAESLQQTREKAAAQERGRVQNIRLAAQEERTRIAREMHDVVAHSLSVIVVQSDGASYALDSALEQAADSGDPEAMAAALRTASSALTTIGHTARESLADTRRLVAVLRQDDGGAEYAPSGGVDSLGDLIDPLRSAGLSIATDTTGCPRPLSRASDLAVYRIVQEALTNVIKHAGDAQVWVSLDYLPDCLLVTVRDNGVGVTNAPDGHGHGLVGMKERLVAVGGGLWAGGASGGGFLVEARVPYDFAGPSPHGTDEPGALPPGEEHP